VSPRPPTHSSEELRSEPEIISPLREKARGDAMWSSTDDRGTHRIYVTRLGPFSVAALLLGITSNLNSAPSRSKVAKITPGVDLVEL
jgi:hypothetical protein